MKLDFCQALRLGVLKLFFNLKKKDRKINKKIITIRVFNKYLSVIIESSVNLFLLLILFHYYTSFLFNYFFCSNLSLFVLNYF